MTKQYNEENIRVAAYYIWEQAGRPEGADKECWIKAVEQLFSAKPACKKTSCKSSSKVAMKTSTKKTTAKSALKVSAKPVIKAKKSAMSLTPSSGSLNAPFYGAKKK